MRIIAGKAKGRRLAGPKSDRIRPTADRVREALFSILGDVEGAVVVDAFAGTGALGLEALSRGAELCYFFDSSRRAIETIEENIQRIGFEQDCIVRRCTFSEGLRDTVEGTPDLWFFDPPYGTRHAEQGLTEMAASPEVVTAGALVVWEAGVDEEIFEVSGFEVVDQRIYGTTQLVFFRRLREEGIRGRAEIRDHDGSSAGRNE